MESIMIYGVVTILVWAISLTVAFFLIRFAVRANEQIRILKEISDKQSALINTMMSVDRRLEIKDALEGSVKSDKDYLAEAREKAGG